MHRLCPVVFLAAAIALAGLLSGCEDGGGVREVTEKRSGVKPTKPVKADATSEERFGMTPAAMPSMQGLPEGHPAPAAAEYTWNAPSEWTVQPSSQFRTANFTFGPQNEGECYLSVLPGGGGGIDANINRWQEQMGLEPLSTEQIAALPKVDMLNGEAAFIEAHGAFAGMGGEAVPGYALLGAAVMDGLNAVFVKMTGPAALVEAEKDRFIQFCASLDKQATAPSTPPPAMAAAGAPQSEGRALELAWDVPPGWEPTAERPMRLVTFSVSGAPEVECYVSVFGHMAGGLEANLNRWRAQMGVVEPISAVEMAEMPTIEILGRPAVLLAVTGPYTGMAGETRENYRMLAAACELDDASVFVKMTGPADAVEEQRDAFMAFCSSLRPQE